MKQELLIGCGSKWDKRLTIDGTMDWSNLTTLDYNSDHNPDIVHDLMSLPLPFTCDQFDEIHAYEVLEHLGQQGDYRLFFDQFSEFWRILKPDGYLMATVPSRHSVWALGDPSHTRIIVPENLVFLDQRQYAAQVGKTSMSDFRNIYKSSFEVVWYDDDKETFKFIIKAVKEKA